VGCDASCVGVGCYASCVGVGCVIFGVVFLLSMSSLVLVSIFCISNK
jgi:hypothetical protein